jgi:hypothetical protein
MARPRAGQCCYCLEFSAAREREHVFPASWYPSTTPEGAERIKVPSCSRCNREMGVIEERLLRSWALCIDSTDPAAIGVSDGVHKSMDAARGRDAFDTRVRAGTKAKLKRSIRPVAVSASGAFPGSRAVGARWMQLPSGLVALAAPALDIDGKDVAAFTRKLVRGLHFYLDGAAIPADRPIKTYTVSEGGWPEIAARIATMNPRGVPPGFIFWRGSAEEDPTFSFWYFLIWGQVFLQAATIPDGDL